jgi:hypothetical protein
VALYGRLLVGLLDRGRWLDHNPLLVVFLPRGRLVMVFLPLDLLELRRGEGLALLHGLLVVRLEYCLGHVRLHRNRLHSNWSIGWLCGFRVVFLLLLIDLNWFLSLHSSLLIDLVGGWRRLEVAYIFVHSGRRTFSALNNLLASLDFGLSNDLLRLFQPSAALCDVNYVAAVDLPVLLRVLLQLQPLPRGDPLGGCVALL